MVKSNHQVDQLLLYKVLQRGISCHIGGNYYFIYYPSIKIVYKAEQLYHRYLQELRYLELLTNDFDTLYRLHLWTEQEQSDLDTLPERINQLKMDLYDAYINFRQRDTIREQLTYVYNQYVELLQKKNRIFLYTDEGLATTWKSYYLIYRTTKCKHEYLHRQGKFDNTDFVLLERLYQIYQTDILENHLIRKLARSDMWRNYYKSNRSIRQLFNAKLTSLSVNQLSLLNWSSFYDNVYKSAECPVQVVIDDDDMLDGWALFQSKRRESEKSHQDIDKKHDKADEVFIVAHNKDDAKRIGDLNSSQAKLLKQRQLQKR